MLQRHCFSSRTWSTQNSSETKPEGFTKLNAIQDAALMRSSSQEAELQFLHNEDISNGPISLGNNNDSGSISQYLFPSISTKSLPLNESKYLSNKTISYSTDFPYISLYAPSSQNTPNNPVLYIYFESFPILDLLIDEVLGQLLTNK